MKYRGLYDESRGRVILCQDGDCLALLPSGREVWEFSTVMDWGGGNAGAVNQLALALLLNATGEQGLSLEAAALFAKCVVSRLHRDGFELDQVDVLRFAVRFCGRFFVAPTEIELTGREVDDASDPTF